MECFFEETQKVEDYINFLARGWQSMARWYGSYGLNIYWSLNRKSLLTHVARLILCHLIPSQADG